MGVQILARTRTRRSKRRPNAPIVTKGVCMKTIDIMAQLLEKNNIPVLEGATKKNGSSVSDNKERCHALVVGSSDTSTFIIDLGASRHMESFKEFFTSINLDSGPTV